MPSSSGFISAALVMLKRETKGLYDIPKYTSLRSSPSVVKLVKESKRSGRIVRAGTVNGKHYLKE